MLDLSDERWSRLRHAFGPANDLPEKLLDLAQLEGLPRTAKEEPLVSLWEAICHQACPDEAAYAAVPHLVRIIASFPTEQRDAVLHLVGSIAAFEEHGAACPEDLRPAYEKALDECRALTLESLVLWAKESPRSEHVLPLLADLAAIEGLPRLGRALQQLEVGEVEILCGHCGTREYLGVGEAGLEIEPLHWSQRPDMPQPPLSAPFALPSLRSAGESAATRLLARLALGLGAFGVARAVSELGGSIECPSCAKPVPVLGAIDGAAWGW